MPLKKRSRHKKRERNRRRVGTAVAAAILLGWLLAPSGHRDDLTMDDDSIADASLLDASDSSVVDAPDSDGKAASGRRQAAPSNAINPFDGAATSTDSFVALDLGDEGGAEIVADLVNAVDTGAVADTRPSLSASNGYSDSGGSFGGFGGFFGGAGGFGGGVAPPAYVNRRSSGIAGQRGNESSETTGDDAPATEETANSNAGGNGNGHGGNVTFAPPDPKNNKGHVSVLPTDDAGDSILTDPDAPDPPGKPGPSGNDPAAPAPVTNPEPASLVLLGSGLALTAHSLRRRRRNR